MLECLHEYNSQQPVFLSALPGRTHKNVRKEGEEVDLSVLVISKFSSPASYPLILPYI